MHCSLSECFSACLFVLYKFVTRNSKVLGKPGFAKIFCKAHAVVDRVLWLKG